MNMTIDMLQRRRKDRLFLIIAGVLLLLYGYGVWGGRRICHCKTTEEWKPGGW
ncbi:hypothetical protein KTO58_25840 [Chitinophaga pendula]|uniref:hypothetical protein n=1 Tax=Chitinophaga TaxID=79328 RepID=UPI0012FD60B1|nr:MULTISPECIES: hypothetical protein [Chitinophaga]UCJ07049.1 hypothetical protein KTO58_25840 [Chitinophaga pendula]